ncbi:AP2/ERF domain-containing protein PFD0985w-like [Artemia franciscana]|uniref:AP2/ERF domain-containing protein PFD0985w-like n=1 Tax=Artemia franciscana TaxID=6661 RepID=UPI0032DAF826
MVLNKRKIIFIYWLILIGYAASAPTKLRGSLRGQRAGPVLETTATETTFGHPKLARPWFPRPVIVNVIDDYSLIQRSLSFEKLASDVRSGNRTPVNGSVSEGFQPLDSIDGFLGQSVKGVLNGRKQLLEKVQLIGQENTKDDKAGVAVTLSLTNENKKFDFEKDIKNVSQKSHLDHELDITQQSDIQIEGHILGRHRNRGDDSSKLSTLDNLESSDLAANLENSAIENEDLIRLGGIPSAEDLQGRNQEMKNNAAVDILSHVSEKEETAERDVIEVIPKLEKNTEDIQKNVSETLNKQEGNKTNNVIKPLYIPCPLKKERDYSCNETVLHSHEQEGKHKEAILNKPSGQLLDLSHPLKFGTAVESLATSLNTDEKKLVSVKSHTMNLSDKTFVDTLSKNNQIGESVKSVSSNSTNKKAEKETLETIISFDNASLNNSASSQNHSLTNKNQILINTLQEAVLLNEDLDGPLLTSIRDFSLPLPGEAPEQSELPAASETSSEGNIKPVSKHPNNTDSDKDVTDINLSTRLESLSTKASEVRKNLTKQSNLGSISSISPAKFSSSLREPLLNEDLLMPSLPNVSAKFVPENGNFTPEMTFNKLENYTEKVPDSESQKKVTDSFTKDAKNNQINDSLKGPISIQMESNAMESSFNKGADKLEKEKDIEGKEDFRIEVEDNNMSISPSISNLTFENEKIINKNHFTGDILLKRMKNRTELDKKKENFKPKEPGQKYMENVKLDIPTLYQKAETSFLDNTVKKLSNTDIKSLPINEEIPPSHEFSEHFGNIVNLNESVTYVETPKLLKESNPERLETGLKEERLNNKALGNQVNKEFSQIYSNLSHNGTNKNEDTSKAQQEEITTSEGMEIKSSLEDLETGYFEGKINSKEHGMDGFDNKELNLVEKTQENSNTAINKEVTSDKSFATVLDKPKDFLKIESTSFNQANVNRKDNNLEMKAHDFGNSVEAAGVPSQEKGKTAEDETMKNFQNFPIIGSKENNTSTPKIKEVSIAPTIKEGLKNADENIGAVEKGKKKQNVLFQELQTIGVEAEEQEKPTQTPLYETTKYFQDRNSTEDKASKYEEAIIVPKVKEEFSNSAENVESTENEEEKHNIILEKINLDNSLGKNHVTKTAEEVTKNYQSSTENSSQHSEILLNGDIKTQKDNEFLGASNKNNLDSQKDLTVKGTDEFDNLTGKEGGKLEGFGNGGNIETKENLQWNQKLSVLEGGEKQTALKSGVVLTDPNKKDASILEDKNRRINFSNIDKIRPDETAVTENHKALEETDEDINLSSERAPSQGIFEVFQNESIQANEETNISIKTKTVEKEDVVTVSGKGQENETNKQETVKDIRKNHQDGVELKLEVPGGAFKRVNTAKNKNGNFTPEILNAESIKGLKDLNEDAIISKDNGQYSEETSVAKEEDAQEEGNDQKLNSKSTQNLNISSVKKKEMLGSKLVNIYKNEDIKTQATFFKADNQNLNGPKFLDGNFNINKTEKHVVTNNVDEKATQIQNTLENFKDEDVLSKETANPNSESFFISISSNGSQDDTSNKQPTNFMPNLPDGVEHKLEILDNLKDFRRLNAVESGNITPDISNAESKKNLSEFNKDKIKPKDTEQNIFQILVTKKEKIEEEGNSSKDNNTTNQTSNMSVDERAEIALGTKMADKYKNEDNTTKVTLDKVDNHNLNQDVLSNNNLTKNNIKTPEKTNNTDEKPIQMPKTKENNFGDLEISSIDIGKHDMERFSYSNSSKVNQKILSRKQSGSIVAVTKSVTSSSTSDDQERKSTSDILHNTNIKVVPDQTSHQNTKTPSFSTSSNETFKIVSSNFSESIVATTKSKHVTLLNRFNKPSVGKDETTVGPEAKVKIETIENAEKIRILKEDFQMEDMSNSNKANESINITPPKGKETLEEKQDESFAVVPTTESLETKNNSILGDTSNTRAKITLEPLIEESIFKSKNNAMVKPSEEGETRKLDYFSEENINTADEKQNKKEKEPNNAKISLKKHTNTEPSDNSDSLNSSVLKLGNEDLLVSQKVISEEENTDSETVNKYNDTEITTSLDIMAMNNFSEPMIPFASVLYSNDEHTGLHPTPNSSSELQKVSKEAEENGPMLSSALNKGEHILEKAEISVNQDNRSEGIAQTVNLVDEKIIRTKTKGESTEILPGVSNTTENIFDKVEISANQDNGSESNGQFADPVDTFTENSTSDPNKDVINGTDIARFNKSKIVDNLEENPKEEPKVEEEVTKKRKFRPKIIRIHNSKAQFVDEKYNDDKPLLRLHQLTPKNLRAIKELLLMKKRERMAQSQAAIGEENSRPFRNSRTPARKVKFPLRRNI